MPASQLNVAITGGARFDNRYDIIEFLGGGAYGEVWKAHDTNTGRTVALKLINPLHATPDMAWQEATHLTSLESRYLVRVHGAALSHLGIPYLDMALADGSVTKTVDPYGVPEGAAIKWMQRVAQGLHLCHTRRLLHRDVKPDNILLSSTGDALLGDFGVTAVMAADDTATEHGDANIRAPEAFGGRCTVVGDVYSLGVTLYNLVTGTYPHDWDDYGNDLTAFTQAARGGVPDVRVRAPHLSLGVARVIRTATQVDPSLRYPTADAFDTALARLAAPRRHVAEVSPCQPPGRCWDAEAASRSSLRPVHVCSAPAGSNRVQIVARHPGGNRIREHCAEVIKGQANARLRALFRDIT